MSEELNIVIDGKKVSAKPGDMIIKVAEDNGVWIPRFCYHRKLSIAANCRMCLVEVKGGRKPMPACATPVMNGMEVFTKSKVALAAQKAVMEFLLINHPLDCPVCDQGGQCELQDIAMGYGSGISRYYEGKISVADQNLGPLIATEMTRCIQCTRCVRFGAEVAGVREMGQTGRGESERIGTYVKHTVSHELSGNIIDLCPVGALTSKPARFTYRPWELEQHKGIAAHDCVGSNIYHHTRRGHLMQVVPRDNDDINESWLSDRDRFSYTANYSAERLQQPMIKQQGQWHEVSWQQALEFAANSIEEVVEHRGGDGIAALSSPNSTCEEQFLLQRLMRGLGSNHIDHRLRQLDFDQQQSTAHYPGSSMPIADIAKADAILLVGSHIRNDQPMLGHHIRQAGLHGAKLMSINSVDYDLTLPQAQRCIVSPAKYIEYLAGIAKALVAQHKEPVKIGDLLDNVKASDEQTSIAQALLAAKKPLIMLGLQIEQHQQAACIYSLADMIAMLCAGSVCRLTQGANAAGAWLAGALPHRDAGALAVDKPGLHARKILKEDIDAYILLNVDPLLDCANGHMAVERLSKAPMVVALTPFKTDSLLECANILLPVATVAETSGTFVNAAGVWQSFSGAAKPYAEARPAWKVLRVLANILKLMHFDFESSTQVLQALQKACHDMPSTYQWQPPAEVAQLNSMTLVCELPMYRSDIMVRHADCLQAMNTPEQTCARLNSKTASLAKLSIGDKVLLIQGKHQLQLPLAIDERIADDTIVISSGLAKTAGLCSKAVQISKAE